MSKVKPIFITPANPVGLDKIVAQLQQVISQASYTDESSTEQLYFNQGLLLPLALKNEATDEPIVYWKQETYYPANPDDAYRIKSFFYQEDTSTFESYNDIRYLLNLVVWFNQDQYSRNKDYQIKEYLIAEILGLLREFLRAEDKTTLETYRELENVFSNYTFTSEDKTRMKYPYQAFRIRFALSEEFDCSQEPLLNLTP